VEWYGIFMERSNLALFKQIRKAVKAMRQDGTFSRLNTKWF
jgi:ABC-type amino acid transport substrate-binding protein